MVVETAAHRSRIFTATWPWSNGHGGHLGIGGSGTEEHHDPYCQVGNMVLSFNAISMTLRRGAILHCTAKLPPAE